MSAISPIAAAAPPSSALSERLSDNVLQALWEAIKRFLGAKPATALLTPQAIYVHMQGLRSELFSIMLDSCSAMPAPTRQAFALRATAMVNDVLLDCMASALERDADRSIRDLKEQRFRRAAAKARHCVHRHMQVAKALERGRLAVPEVRCVQVENPGGPHLPKLERIVVLRAAPPIEHLVLRGGGAKGIGNPPALRALENLGKLSELKKVVGTSAGALTAVCLASGLSAQSFQRLSNDMPLLSLLASPGDFAQRYPEVQFGTIGFSAGQALATLDRASAGSVRDYLRAHWAQIEAGPQWCGLSATDQARLASLRDQDMEQVPRTALMVTFRDLQLLHHLAPARFRELVLTGYDMDTKQTAYFSAATHADMPVALAGRISMGIPLFFKAVKLDVAGEPHSFVDGGVGSNMPSEAILDGLHGEALGEALARTLLMTYDDQGAAYSILHGSPAERRNASEGLLSHWVNDRDDALKIHFSGANVLPVFHGKLGTFSFAASAAQIAQAQTQSMLQTLEYIEHTMGQVRHELVADAAAAVGLLSADERSSFLLQHGSDGDPLHAALCRVIRAQSPVPLSGPVPGDAP